MALSGEGGLRLICVVTGTVRVDLRALAGTRSTVLVCGDAFCVPADYASGHVANEADGTATVVHAVIDFGDHGVPWPAASASGEGGLDGPAVVASPVTTAVLDAITAPGVARDLDYRRHAGRYLCAHLTTLLPRPRDPDDDGHAPSGGGVGAAEGNDGDSPGVQPFSAEQQELVVDAMRARLADRVSVEELASLLGYSQYHFLRRFKATFGLTPYQYLTALRVRAAQQWLERPDRRSLGWIASQCGFHHTASLIRAFRKRVGVTPARYAADHAQACPTARDGGRGGPARAGGHVRRSAHGT